MRQSMHFDKIRTMIVGMGGISRTMLRSLEKKSWHELVAVVDVNEEALKRAAADYSLPAAALFTDLQRRLRKLVGKRRHDQHAVGIALCADQNGAGSWLDAARRQAFHQ